VFQKLVVQNEVAFVAVSLGQVQGDVRVLCEHYPDLDFSVSYEPEKEGH
jgi:hypothetical protein